VEGKIFFQLAARNRFARMEEHISAIFDGDEKQIAYAERVIAHPPTGTIPCMAVDSNGDISATTTTSGLSWKIPGRVGDSPIMGGLLRRQ